MPLPFFIKEMIYLGTGTFDSGTILPPIEIPPASDSGELEEAPLFISK
jgi:hypothetical protein